MISERSSDKWEVKWYLVIRSPRGVITERWLAEWEKEPRPELQKTADVQPIPLPERTARGQWMTAVHPADEGLDSRSPMHLRTKTKKGSYMIWPDLAWLIKCTWTLNPLPRAAELSGRFLNYFERKGRYVSRKISPGRINCLGHLLLTTQTPEKILPIWPAPLAFCWLGAPAYFFFCQYIFYKDGQIANRS